MQQIIQDDIINYNLGYWCEASGGVEYYFKKYNGFPVSNIMAAQTLGIDESQITLSDKDDVHYTRNIGASKEPFEKMIFGFKSEAEFNEILKHVDDYECFMNTVNSQLQESTGKYTIRQCYYIINNIYRLNEENEFNELLPSWYQALKECLSILNAVEDKDDVVGDYIHDANYLLNWMPVLTLHKFEIHG